MDVGRRLDFERRFDRLGLDAELIALEHAVEEKDALELGNIAPTLSAIAGNQEMMKRVRIRATKLLEQSDGAGSASKRSSTSNAGTRLRCAFSPLKTPLHATPGIA